MRRGLPAVHALQPALLVPHRGSWRPRPVPRPDAEADVLAPQRARWRRCTAHVLSRCGPRPVRNATTIAVTPTSEWSSSKPMHASNDSMTAPGTAHPSGRSGRRTSATVDPFDAGSRRPGSPQRDLQCHVPPRAVNDSTVGMHPGIKQAGALERGFDKRLLLLRNGFSEVHQLPQRRTCEARPGCRATSLARVGSGRPPPRQLRASRSGSLSASQLHGSSPSRPCASS